MLVCICIFDCVYEVLAEEGLMIWKTKFSGLRLLTLEQIKAEANSKKCFHQFLLGLTFLENMFGIFKESWIKDLVGFSLRIEWLTCPYLSIIC